MILQKSNHCNMLIYCSKNIYDYYQHWKQKMYTFVKIMMHMIFF